MKLKLDIDKDQSESEAAWFKYAPPTGNTMYSMPIVGTSAKLYFSDETCNEPLVSGCVRNNGSSCEKTADTTKRYFGTEHGSEVEMTPSAINIKGGSKSPISISIDDNVGITITSPKKLNLSADSDDEAEAGKKPEPEKPKEKGIQLGKTCACSSCISIYIWSNSSCNSIRSNSSECSCRSL